MVTSSTALTRLASFFQGVSKDFPPNDLLMWLTTKAASVSLMRRLVSRSRLSSTTPFMIPPTTKKTVSLVGSRSENRTLSRQRRIIMSREKGRGAPPGAKLPRRTQKRILSVIELPCLLAHLSHDSGEVGDPQRRKDCRANGGQSERQVPSPVRGVLRSNFADPRQRHTAPAAVTLRAGTGASRCSRRAGPGRSCRGLDRKWSLTSSRCGSP